MSRWLLLLSALLTLPSQANWPTFQGFSEPPKHRAGLAVYQESPKTAAALKPYQEKSGRFSLYEWNSQSTSFSFYNLPSNRLDYKFHTQSDVANQELTDYRVGRSGPRPPLAEGRTSSGPRPTVPPFTAPFPRE